MPKELHRYNDMKAMIDALIVKYPAINTNIKR